MKKEYCCRVCGNPKYSIITITGGILGPIKGFDFSFNGKQLYKEEDKIKYCFCAGCSTTFHNPNKFRVCVRTK